MSVVTTIKDKCKACYESGVGKEVLARAVYMMSRRSHEPFIAINCAALPEHLIESELFGYEDGAKR